MTIQAPSLTAIDQLSNGPSWSDDDEILALLQGWKFAGVNYIRYDPLHGRFQNDEQAIAFVEEQANAGEATAMTAIRLHRQNQPSTTAVTSQTSCVPPAETEAGKAVVKDILAPKEASALAGQVWSITLGVLCAIGCAVGIYHQHQVAWLLGLFTFGFLALSGKALPSWTREEYYRVPGSRNAEGEHVCIYCGHLGYSNWAKRGRFITYRWAECPACEKHLWDYPTR